MNDKDKFTLVRFTGEYKDGKYYSLDGKEITTQLYERYIRDIMELHPNEIRSIFSEFRIVKERLNRVEKNIRDLLV